MRTAPQARHVLLGLLALGGLLSCAIISEIDRLHTDRLSVDWATPLYNLEPFAYKPTESARLLYVRGDEGADAMVIVPSRDRRVRGLDAASGGVLWELETRGPNVAQPTAHGDELLIGSMDGHVYRVWRRNGRTIWVSDFPGSAGVFAAPTVDDGRVFVTSVDNRLTVLDLETGERLWDRRRSHPSEFTITGQAGVTIVGDYAVTGFSDGQLVAFAKDDGSTYWAADLTGGQRDFVDVDTTPLLVDKVVVASSYRRGLFGVDADSGDVLWIVRGEGFAQPAELDGTLYAPRANGRVVAVDAADGRVIWESEVWSRWATTPAVSESYVIVPIGASLSLLDRGSGRTVMRFDDGRGFSATPELAWGTLYAVANSGTVYALGVYR